MSEKQTVALLRTLVGSIARGDAKIVRSVLEKGIVDVNTSDERGVSLLSLACSGDNDCDEVVQALIDHGAAICSRSLTGSTAAHFAARLGYVKSLQRLVTSDREVVRVTNAGGDTPLHFAALGGHVSCFEALVVGGAPVDCLNGAGMSVLHCLVAGDATTVTDTVQEVMAAHPGLVNQPDVKGRTPLHHACIAGNDAAVGALLDGGADVTVRDGAGAACWELRGLKPACRALIDARLHEETRAREAAAAQLEESLDTSAVTIATGKGKQRKRGGKAAGASKDGPGSSEIAATLATAPAPVVALQASKTASGGGTAPGKKGGKGKTAETAVLRDGGAVAAPAGESAGAEERQSLEGPNATSADGKERKERQAGKRGSGDAPTPTADAEFEEDEGGAWHVATRKQRVGGRDVPAGQHTPRQSAKTAPAGTAPAVTSHRSTLDMQTGKQPDKPAAAKMPPMVPARALAPHTSERPAPSKTKAGAGASADKNWARVASTGVTEGDTEFQKLLQGLHPQAAALALNKRHVLGVDLGELSAEQLEVLEEILASVLDRVKDARAQQDQEDAACRAETEAEVARGIRAFARSG